SVVALLWAFAVSLPAGADAQPAGAKTQKVPEALVDFGELGENVYDLSKASDWAKASEKFKALKDVAKAFPSDLKETKAEKNRCNDYGKWATPILDQVDNLEKVFKK